MQRLLLLTACGLVLSGCASHTWVKEGSSAENQDADRKACVTTANPYAGAQYTEVFESCMSGKGYEKKTNL